MLWDLLCLSAKVNPELPRDNLPSEVAERDAPMMKVSTAPSLFIIGASLSATSLGKLSLGSSGLTFADRYQEPPLLCADDEGLDRT
jgi:hypothetical protein